MKFTTIFLIGNKLMKYSFLTLFIFIIFSTIVRSDIEIAKGQCGDLGFKPGTEKYADCVMKLLPKEGTEKKIIEVVKEVKGKDKDKKVVNAKMLKFEEATYVGEIKKGKAHGFGIFTFSDGSTYEGKVLKNRINGIGKYTDSQGKVYEGKFRNGTLKIKIDKKTRDIIKLKAKTGIETYSEIKGKGSVSSKWFEATKNSSGTYEMTAKGKREMESAKKAADSSGGDSGNSSSSGGCGG